MWNTLASLVIVLFVCGQTITLATLSCCSTAWGSSDICRVIEGFNSLESTVLELKQQANNTQRPSVAFSVGLSTDFTGNGIVKYDSVIYNDGLYYNATTGNFTAPVAGTYYFSMSTWARGYARVIMVKNGLAVVGMDGAGVSMSDTAIIKLQPGDTVAVIRSSYTPGTMVGAQPDTATGLVNIYYSTFSGFKIAS